MNNKKKTLKTSSLIMKLLLSIVSVSIFLIIVEAGYRFARVFFRAASYQVSSVVADNKFGWVLNTELKKTISTNKCGEKVIRNPYEHRLIVKYPKYKNQKKILFIGDSSTEASSVSTGYAYYDVFEEFVKNNFSVYAAGVGGYGNLQEYLMLNEIFLDIKPDIVFWQLDINDISNNVYELDKSDFFNNQRPRPYLNLNNDLIDMKNPGFFLFDYSHSFRFLFYRIVILDRKYNLGILKYLNSLIELDELTKKMLEKKGSEILDRVLKLSMSKYPDSKFIGFSISENDVGKKIFNENGAIYFDQFGFQINNFEDANCKPLDYHLNFKGNRLAGKLLYDYFMEHTLETGLLEQN